MEKPTKTARCPDKPVFSPTVTLSSTDRCEGRFSPSSAVWLTSVMPFTGCHLVFFGLVDSQTGWLGWWAQSHLWLVWCRWMSATVTSQTAHNFHLNVRNRLDVLIRAERTMYSVLLEMLSERICSRSLMWSDNSQTVSVGEEVLQEMKCSIIEN